MMSNKIKFLLIALLSITIISCKSTDDAKYATDEEVYLNGLKYFKDKKYQLALETFDIISLQYPASKYADDAQYYIAEINFAEEKYVLAEFNYQKLVRNYPASDYTKTATYQVALCNYFLSPTYDRDQQYTQSAIKAFQEFQMLYPADSLSKEANGKIQELRDKLAYREFYTAEIYQKLDSPISSILYYDEVIKNFQDTKYYEPAFFGKINTLYNIKRYEQIKSLIQIYKQTFPKSDNLAKINEIEANIK
jgi:outer membrane protein assembly factor BamD